MEINGLIIESVVVGSVGTNCYIVHKKDSDHCFVVDPGDSGDKIANYIRDQKMILDHILLTHGHFDHIQGVRNLCAGCRERTAFGCLHECVSNDRKTRRTGSRHMASRRTAV